ncbi:hypothetical protein ACQUY5_27170 [Bacillus cereus]|uniref:hypothetical protein n=1 Tax=Bacillus cereus TaxID=1396 RepID=UPI003D16C8C8
MENQYIEFLKEIEALGKEQGFRVDRFEYGLRKEKVIGTSMTIEFKYIGKGDNK